MIPQCRVGSIIRICSNNESYVYQITNHMGPPLHLLLFGGLFNIFLYVSLYIFYIYIILT